MRTSTSLPCGFGVSTMVSHSGASNLTNDWRRISAMAFLSLTTFNFVVAYIGQFAGHGNKAADRNGLGAPGQIDIRRGGQPGRIDGQRFEALPQHFPPLAERRRRHLLQRPAVARLPARCAAPAAPPTR